MACAAVVGDNQPTTAQRCGEHRRGFKKQGMGN